MKNDHKKWNMSGLPGYILFGVSGLNRCHHHGQRNCRVEPIRVIGARGIITDTVHVTDEEGHCAEATKTRARGP